MQRSAIRQARKDRGMTQGQLADAVGVNQGTVSKWESGAREISVEDLENIAKALSVDISALEVSEKPKGKEVVSGPSSFARWFNELSKSGIDPEFFTVMIVIGREASVPPWVASVSIGYLADTTPLTRPTLERLWPQVLESEWLERRGSGEWTFILKFPE